MVNCSPVLPSRVSWWATRPRSRTECTCTPSTTAPRAPSGSVCVASGESTTPAARRAFPINDAVRRSLGIADDQVLIGWVGRLDRKKRVEDFIRAAAIVAEREPQARFVVVGGPDAFMPEYRDELHRLAT